MTRVATSHEPTRLKVPLAGSRHRLVLMGFVVFLALMASTAVPGHAQSSRQTKEENPRRATEVEIKAGYLMVIPEHIRWPGTILDDASDSLVIAVIDDPEVADALNGRIATRLAFAATKPSAKPKNPIVVRSFECDALAEDPTLLDGCHVVYLPSRVPGKNAKRVLRLLIGLPVLTVEDSGRKGGPKADIELFKTGKSIKFGIRVTALRARGLEARARLVRLGKTLTSEAFDAERREEAGPSTGAPPAENSEKGGGR